MTPAKTFWSDKSDNRQWYMLIQYHKNLDKIIALIYSLVNNLNE